MTGRSASMTVAAIALIIGLAGTAIAGPEAITSALTQSKVKKIAKQQAKKQIKKAAPGLSVKHASTADTARSAETARPTGPAGGDLAGAYPDPSIGDQGVSSDEIADDAVTSAKIANEQVHASELGATQLVSADSNTVANGATAGATATCPAGSKLISGGFEGGGDSAAWRVHRSSPLGNGWHAFGTNQTGANSHLEVRAICLVGP